MSDTAAGAEGAGRSVPPTTRARVAEIFADTGFQRYFATRAVSQLGDGLFQLAAAAVLLFENPGPNPTMDLLAVSIVTLVPFSALGPFVGVFIDRWERRKILVRVPIGRALIAALVPVAALAGTRSIPFYVVVLVVLSANRFFLATMSAVLPQLVPEDDLLVANSVSTTGGAITNVAGQAIGTAVAGLIGGELTALFAAMAFAASTLAARKLQVHRGLDVARAPIGEEIREVLREMVEGAREVSRDRRVVFALSAITVTQVLVGGLIGVLTYYFIAILRLEVRAATSILAFLAIGIGVGVLLVPMVARRVREDTVVALSFVIAGAGGLITLVNLTRTTLVIGAAIAGTAYAFAKIPVDTIVQEQIPDEIRGRAFALYDVVFNLARVTGVAVVAVLYGAGAETSPIVAGISGAYAIAAVVFFSWERSAMFRRRRRQDPARLLVPGEFVTVRAYAGMRADEEPRTVIVGGNELSIEAIEWRAVTEDVTGARRRAFVCRVAGLRVRLSVDDDGTWIVERLLPAGG